MNVHARGIVVLAALVLAAACSSSSASKAAERVGPDASRFEVRAVEHQGATREHAGAAERVARSGADWLLLGPTLINGYDVKSVQVHGVRARDEFTIQLEVDAAAAGRAVSAARTHPALAFLVDAHVVRVAAAPRVMGDDIVLGDGGAAIVNVDLFAPRAVVVSLAGKITSGAVPIDAASADATDRRGFVVCEGFVPRVEGLTAFGGFTARLTDRANAIRITNVFHLDTATWDHVPDGAAVGDCNYYMGGAALPHDRYLVRYLVVAHGPTLRLTSRACEPAHC